MKKILLRFFVFGILAGYIKHKKKEESSNDLDKVLSEENYLIVDVRTKEEYDDGHVVGAILLPYDEIDENVELDKNKTILVYCRSGRRSILAKSTLESLGYQVIDLGAFESLDLEKEE